MSECPCGLKVTYKECCAPFITGELTAPTAEKLLRSRYSAFVKKSVDYITTTHDPNTRADYDVEETRKWADESTWENLEIVKVHGGNESDEEAEIEFIATYIQAEKTYRHHELSSFRKDADRWYFIDGKIINDPITRDGNKIGRNDPCFCGSGKKYKKCCL